MQLQQQPQLQPQPRTESLPRLHPLPQLQPLPQQVATSAPATATRTAATPTANAGSVGAQLGAQPFSHDDARALELNYILRCQSQGGSVPRGAINDIYPTSDGYSWIVPSEMAVVGWTLFRLGRPEAATSAASYLVTVQSQSGCWKEQFNAASPSSNLCTTRHTVQPVMFIAGLQAKGAGAPGYINALVKAAAWLVSQLHPSGLIGGGDNGNGEFWLSDNAYAVVAWHRLGQLQRRDAAVRAINKHFLSNDRWHYRLGRDLLPIQGPFSWIHFAPAMLDLRDFGVEYPQGLGDRIIEALQVRDGPNAGAVYERESSPKMMPGIGFQASLAWRDLGLQEAVQAHTRWCLASGLWHTAADSNGISGGWVDWKEASGQIAPAEQRFIDTSAYFLMVTEGVRFHDGPQETPAAIALFQQHRQQQPRQQQHVSMGAWSHKARCKGAAVCTVLVAMSLLLVVFKRTRSAAFGAKKWLELMSLTHRESEPGCNETVSEPTMHLMHEG